MGRIERFDGEYRFLSNFYRSRVMAGGLMFQSLEHAYQASKTFDLMKRREIAALSSPGEAKRAGKKLLLRSDWESVKLTVMEALLRQKFSFEPLRSRLLDTGSAELVEGNHWGDTFWGICRGTGENHLGRLLMMIRSELQSAKMSSGAATDWRVYKGWILAPKDQEGLLKRFGVSVGPWAGDRFVDCEVPAASLLSIDRNWTPILWGLHPVPSDSAL
jgi:ribA/ribD-fused uncharacterized protein